MTDHFRGGLSLSRVPPSRLAKALRSSPLLLRRFLGLRVVLLLVVAVIVDRILVGRKSALADVGLNLLRELDRALLGLLRSNVGDRKRKQRRSEVLVMSRLLVGLIHLVIWMP